MSKPEPIFFNSTTCILLSVIIAGIGVIETAVNPSKNAGWCSVLFITAVLLFIFGLWWRSRWRKHQ